MTPSLCINQSKPRLNPILKLKIFSITNLWVPSGLGSWWVNWLHLNLWYVWSFFVFTF
jgi:hypothetical protein